jgi:Fic family protein
MRFKGQDAKTEIAELIASIDKTKAELDGKRPLSQTALKVIREEFAARYTYNSNAIEGNTLTLDETALVLEGLTVAGKPLKDHLEAVGHRDAFEYLLRRLDDGITLTEQFVKEIHSFVLLNDPMERGNYRTNNVKITGSNVKLPCYEQVPDMMASLVKDIAVSKLHPVEKAAVYHLDFERIHPFIDGNGRTGRLIMNMLLMQEGYLPIDIKFANRDRYYQAFKSYDTTHSHDEMVLLVAEHELDELRGRLEI